jgi:hypothetical protein
LFNRKIAQEDGVNQVEHRSIGPDAERQERHHHRGVSGRTQEHASRLADLARSVFHSTENRHIEGQSI